MPYRGFEIRRAASKGAPPEAEAARDLPLNLDQAQRLLAQRALAEAQGNMSEAAARLGIHRAKLYRLLARSHS